MIGSIICNDVASSSLPEHVPCQRASVVQADRQLLDRPEGLGEERESGGEERTSSRFAGIKMEERPRRPEAPSRSQERKGYDERGAVRGWEILFSPTLKMSFQNVPRLAVVMS